MAEPQRESWGSRLGFILAAAGSAIGLGNIWKFPYVAGQNGGAAFVLIYLAGIALLGLPILIGEIIIGRHAKANAVRSYRMFGGSPRWRAAGIWGVAGGILLLSYYCVVGGWTLGYIIKSASNPLGSTSTVQEARELFSLFTGNPVEVVVYHAAFLSLTAASIITGIQNGIEKWNKFLLPLLFVILVILIIRSNTLEGSSRGLAYYLVPDFSRIRVTTFIEAFGQCFFSLSLGLGAMVTYGSYLRGDEHIVRSSAMIVFLDTLAAFMAGLVIFPAAYAFSMDPGQGPGLTFHVIPVIFSRIPLGQLFSVLFFILLAVAALTSAMSLLELAVAFCIDELHWARPKSVVAMSLLVFIVGLPSALSFNLIAGWKPFPGMTFFSLADTLTSSIVLPFGGIWICLALLKSHAAGIAREELSKDKIPPIWISLWIFMMRGIVPVILLLLILYSFLR